jgi:diguanylate cyclase
LQTAPDRDDESDSLAALRALDVLDTAPEAEFDALVQVASAVCGVPISLISLIDRDRQWFKANVGLADAQQTSRDSAFCAHAVLGSELFEVPDARLDARFADNPLVLGQPDIRFYAGAPIVLGSGHRVGTLCVIDREPRSLNDMQRGVLQQLSIAAARLLEGRLASRRARQLAGDLAQREADLRNVLNSVPSMLAYWNSDLVCRFANQAYETWFGVKPEDLLGRHIQDLLGPDLYARNRPYLEAALAGQAQVFERAIPTPDGTVRHSLAHYLPDIVDGKVLGVLVQVSDVTPLKTAEAALRRNVAELEGVNQKLAASMTALQEAQRLGQVGSWDWDVGTDTVTWSDELYRIMGYDPESPAPSFAEHSARFAPESLARLQDAMSHTTRTGDAYTVELEIRRPDGQRAWILAHGEVERDSAGNDVRLRGTAQDITERIRIETDLRKTQDFLARTGALAGVGGWEVDILSGTTVWSDEVCRIHGVEPGFVPALDEALAFYAPKSLPVVRAAVQTAMAGGPGFDLELEIVRRDGQSRFVRTVGMVDFADGQPVRLSGAFQDVTEHHTLSQKLAEQHELLRITLQSIGDAVITTDVRGHVVWLNPIAQHLTGWMATEAEGRPLAQVFHIVHQDTRKLAESPLAACLHAGERSALPHQTLLIARDGREFGIEDSASPIRNEAGEVVGAVLVFHDVSEQRRLASEITYRATHDLLTGLVNRSEFETRLERVLRHAQEEHSQHALLAIDLDQFKLVNDACGHAVGDQLLKQVAKLLGDVIRARDTLARIGGDEFSIILEHCAPEQALRVAQKICDRMDDFRFTHQDRRFRIGASIGLVALDRRWPNAAAVQQAADASCYAAKEAGRNRVHTWFDTDVTMHARRFEMGWTSRIEHALDQGDFVLYAQRIAPLQQMDAGIHAEVLLRMKNADGTLAQPGMFLPAAERFHLINRIDRWVLSTVIAWLKDLDSLQPIALLSVNLSGQSVGDRAFHAWAMQQLTLAGAQVCSRLCLEITETTAVTHMGDAANFVEQVRSVGVKVALDDFGAGASSFGYLKNLSVDYLKIDGQFIRSLTDDSLDDVAVRCFVDVARVLGLHTVAEFVDQQEVMDRLRGIGVDFAQGYLVHRPEPLAQLFAVPAA